MMATWPADGVLLFTLVEAVALIVARRQWGGRLKRLDIVLLLLPGAVLLVALRFALLGHRGWSIAAVLLLAGLAHASDMVRRWRGINARGDCRFHPVAAGHYRSALLGRIAPRPIRSSPREPGWHSFATTEWASGGGYEKLFIRRLWCLTGPCQFR